MDGNHLTRESRWDVRSHSVYVIRSKDRKNAYVGISIAVDERLMKHRLIGTEAVRKILASSHVVDVSNRMTPARAMKLEAALIKRFQKQGVKLANAAPAGGMGTCVSPTFEIVTERAKNYECLSAFKSQAPAAYRAAVKNGWLDQVCAHMRRKNSPRKWTVEALEEEVSKYSSMMEFRKKNMYAYEAAQKRGLLSRLSRMCDNLSYSD